MTKADAIASAVLHEFKKLPANRKPVIRTNGIREWVPLSGIVAEFRDGSLACLALATGMKCLSASKLQASKGVGVHDWHAEVLALRAFNRFILQECHDVLVHGHVSEYLSTGRAREEAADSSARDGQLCAWNEDIALHMYCSEAPCGDCSMELTMAAQHDDTPWALPPPAAAERDGGPPKARQLLSGRGFFSQLGSVRSKPGRGDAPTTLSKSCSDKLALRQCTSLLCGLASLYVAPSPGLYLRSLVLPASQYSEAGCRRCFSAAPDAGRMAAVAGRSWPGGYAYRPLTVQMTAMEFSFSKRSVAESPSPSASSNLSVVWTCHGINECLVGGVLRGRKAIDPAGASSVSRRRLWQLAREVADRAPSSEQTASRLEPLRRLLHAATYKDVKAGDLLAARARAKQSVIDVALQGWVPNTGDSDWSL